MRSIKPGRGPSGMNFAGSIFAVIFGIIWTILAGTMTRGAGILGFIFPLFGVLFVGIGILQARFHYKNYKGDDRMSLFDITEHGEEPDPLERERREYNALEKTEDRFPTEYGYCPYCGASLEADYRFCPKCGRELN